MKRELVPFNDMFTVNGSTEVFRIKTVNALGFVLSNIKDPKKTVATNDPIQLAKYTVDTIDVGDAFDKFYELETEHELPAPEEMDEMKELGKTIGFPDAYPVSVNRVLTMYYNIMEVADDFEHLVDPYVQLDLDTLDSSDMDKPLDHHVKF